VGGYARVAPSRILAGGHEIDVHMQDGHRLVAADVARIGAQEPLQSVQLASKITF
jgi:hypothetical protein